MLQKKIITLIDTHSDIFDSFELAAFLKLLREHFAERYTSLPPLPPLSEAYLPCRILITKETTHNQNSTETKIKFVKADGSVPYEATWNLEVKYLG